jgi:hypothetical protein
MAITAKYVLKISETEMSSHTQNEKESYVATIFDKDLKLPETYLDQRVLRWVAAWR